MHALRIDQASWLHVPEPHAMPAWLAHPAVVLRAGDRLGIGPVAWGGQAGPVRARPAPPGVRRSLVRASVQRPVMHACSQDQIMANFRDASEGGWSREDQKDHGSRDFRDLIHLIQVAEQTRRALSGAGRTGMRRRVSGSTTTI